MNRMLIPAQKLKYVKLLIVSPLYEIVVNLIYIISFFLLAFKLVATNGSLSNYRINQLVNRIYKREAFMNIKTDTDLFNYMEALILNLYTYDSRQKVNIMIPFGSIRLKKYSHQAGKCNIDYTRSCFTCKSILTSLIFSFIDSCTVEELGKIYQNDSLCGYPYQKKHGVSDVTNNDTVYHSLVRDFIGKYSQYNLVNDGQTLDLTINDYNNNHLVYEEFFKDKDLKFAAILFNVYFPMSDTYTFVIAGVEMVNYFTFPHTIFSSTTYIHFNTKDVYFLTLFILFCTSVALNAVKFIYEVNVKFMPAIHLLTLIHEIINIVLIVFISFYMGLSDANTFLIDYANSLGFKDNIPLIMVSSYLHIILALLFLCVPFRVLSLISWYRKGATQVVKYFSVIFRIIPGVLVYGTIMLMIIVVFALMNFFMYNGTMQMFENTYNALIMVFNFQVIRDINLSGSLEHSISHSKYFMLYNVLHMIIFAITFGLGIATFVYLFRKAATIENDKEDNEVAIKLDEIKDKLKKEIMQYDNNLNGMKKQILWLNLNNKNDMVNSPLLKQRVLQFKQGNQIIAFLKYLFALKPDLQFRNLEDKYVIVIEGRAVNGKMRELELEQVDILLDWLSFVGCKIPVVLFSVDKLERNLRMKIATCYFMVRFISQKEDLFGFLNQDNSQFKEHEDKATKVVDMNHMVSQENRFIIYPTIIRKSEEGELQPPVICEAQPKKQYASVLKRTSNSNYRLQEKRSLIENEIIKTDSY